MRALSPKDYNLIATIHQANRASARVCTTQADEFAAGDPAFNGADFLRRCGHPAEGDAYASIPPPRQGSNPAPPLPHPKAA